MFNDGHAYPMHDAKHINPEILSNKFWLKLIVVRYCLYIWQVKKQLVVGGYP
jgi:hypothetical protein